MAAGSSGRPGPGDREHVDGGRAGWAADQGVHVECVEFAAQVEGKLGQAGYGPDHGTEIGGAII